MNIGNALNVVKDQMTNEIIDTEDEQNVSVSHGKIKKTLNSPFLVHGNQSKLLKKIRNCRTCPLGVKEESVSINGRIITKRMPPKCKFYLHPDTNNGQDCIVPIADFIQQSKIYYKYFHDTKLNRVDLQNSLIHQAIMDAHVAREMELLETGMPGFKTADHMERAMKYNNELLKQQNPETHNHLHLGDDTATRMINAVFQSENEQHFAKVKREKEEKEQQERDIN